MCNAAYCTAAAGHPAWPTLDKELVTSDSIDVLGLIVEKIIIQKQQQKSYCTIATGHYWIPAIHVFLWILWDVKEVSIFFSLHSSLLWITMHLIIQTNYCVINSNCCDWVHSCQLRRYLFSINQLGNQKLLPSPFNNTVQSAHQPWSQTGMSPWLDAGPLTK